MAQSRHRHRNTGSHPLGLAQLRSSHLGSHIAGLLFRTLGVVFRVLVVPTSERSVVPSDPGFVSTILEELMSGLELKPANLEGFGPDPEVVELGLVTGLTPPRRKLFLLMFSMGPGMVIWVLLVS